MKLAMDPMPRLRLGAAERINIHFNNVALANVHRDAAHRQKRETAEGLLAGDELDDVHPFIQEAALRGLPADEHARDIVMKADNVQLREIARQRLLHAAQAAITPDEIASLLLDLR